MIAYSSQPTYEGAEYPSLATIISGSNRVQIWRSYGIRDTTTSLDHRLREMLNHTDSRSTNQVQLDLIARYPEYADISREEVQRRLSRQKASGYIVGEGFRPTEWRLVGDGPNV